MVFVYKKYLCFLESDLLLTFRFQSSTRSGLIKEVFLKPLASACSHFAFQLFYSFKLSTSQKAGKWIKVIYEIKNKYLYMANLIENHCSVVHEPI